MEQGRLGPIGSLLKQLRWLVAHRPRPPAVPTALGTPSTHQPPAHPTRLPSPRHRRGPTAHPHPPGTAGSVPAPPRHRLRSLPLRARPPRRRHPSRRTTDHRCRARLPTHHHPGHRPQPAAARAGGCQQLLHRPDRPRPPASRHRACPLVVPAPLPRHLGPAHPAARVRPMARPRHRPRVFLEYRHEERFSDLIAALVGYDDLAQATPQLATNLLVLLPSTRRETELHRTIPPRSYLLATATPREGISPAEAVWLPLGSTGPRQRLRILWRRRDLMTGLGITGVEATARIEVGH